MKEERAAPGPDSAPLRPLTGHRTALCVRIAPPAHRDPASGSRPRGASGPGREGPRPGAQLAPSAMPCRRA